MDFEAFDTLWQRQHDFKFELPEEEEELCTYAQHFALWAEELYQEEVEAPSHVGINQKMLMLLKKYFEWRTVVPKMHRDRIGERGHVCIFHILERSYHRLKVLELTLAPPMLFLPQPSPAATPALTLPARLERALEEYTIGEILGEEIATG
jgi:hypothetical protein